METIDTTKEKHISFWSNVRKVKHENIGEAGRYKGEYFETVYSMTISMFWMYLIATGAICFLLGLAIGRA